jgi:outer membrane lipoprotein-sorting protein
MATTAPSERLEDDEIAGRETYVIVATPAEDQDSGYERIKTWIDKQSCVALRTEFYEHGEQPRKVMITPHERVEHVGDIWVPRQMLMQDRRDETETTLTVEKLEIGVDVNRKMFSEKELLQGAQ